MRRFCTLALVLSLASCTSADGPKPVTFLSPDAKAEYHYDKANEILSKDVQLSDDEDSKAHKEHMKFAAAHGHPIALQFVGTDYALEGYDVILATLDLSARRGNTIAQFDLACQHFEGSTEPPFSRDQAWRWMNAAAEQDHFLAKVNVAFRNLDGVSQQPEARDIHRLVTDTLAADQRGWFVFYSESSLLNPKYFRLDVRKFLNQTLDAQENMWLSSPTEEFLRSLVTLYLDSEMCAGNDHYWKEGSPEPYTPDSNLLWLLK